MRISLHPILLSCLLTTLALGQTRHPHPADASTKPADAPASAPAVEESKLSVTHHQMALDGKSLSYRATAGLMPMKDESGKPKANIFYVAYDTESPDAATRPL